MRSRVATALLLLVVVSVSAPAQGKPIEWLSYPEGLAQADSSGNPLLVKVYTKSCAFCKKLERRVLSRGDVREIIDRGYTPVSLDAEDNTPVARIKDRTLTSRDLAAAYGAKAYPTCLILRPDGQLITRLVGYVPPDSFRTFLTRSLETAASQD